MYDQLGELKAKAILFFHAFTGSDTISAWNTWKAFEEVTEIFANLSVDDDSKEVETLERRASSLRRRHASLIQIMMTCSIVQCGM